MIYFWFVLVSLAAGVLAPPVPVCLVQQDIYKGDQKTPCDDQEKKRLSDLVNSASTAEYQDIELYGTDNMADLILSRSCGIFDYRHHNLQNLFICQKHLDEIGKNWKNARRFRFPGGENAPKCRIPSLEGFQGDHTRAVKGHRTLLKSESMAVWRYYHIFLPAGEGMCPRHEAFIQSLPTGEIQTAATATDGNAGSSNAQPPTGRDVGGHHLRPIRHGHCQSLYESPRENLNFRGMLRKKACQSGSSYEHEPSPDPESIKRSCDQVKEGIRSIASAVGIPCKNVHFAKMFSLLEPETKRKTVNMATHVHDAVMSAFAPDVPKRLEEMIQQKQNGQSWYRRQSDKLAGIVDDVIEQYLKAPNRRTRMDILSIIAPWFEWSELERKIPGLTPYAWKEARKYAKMAKAGLIVDVPSTIRETYNKKKVVAFIQFITSSQVSSDLPFGEAIVKRSTGEKVQIPNLLRASVNTRVIQQFKLLMEHNQAQTMIMSDSTMLRILHTCKATTRKPMKGIDYITYEGTEGIANLIILVKKIKGNDGDADWAREISHVLTETKMFFKTDYKVLIHDDSDIADYSLAFAMSDEVDPNFRIAGSPTANRNKRRCSQCIALMDALQSIESKINEIGWSPNEKAEAEFDFEQSKRGVLEWQKHIVRTIQQEKAKEELFRTMGTDAVHCTLDWAMKFLPEKGRESQLDWYGKKGLSWHIIVCFARNPDTPNVFHQRTYVHVFGQSKQDGEAVTAILVDTLKRIKKELPQITKAYLRSDNAGCYHGASTLTAVPKISEASGITIMRWDFSETQSGKGPADRASNVVKRHVKLTVAEGNSATTATEFIQAASSNNGVKSATFVLADLKSAPEGGRKPSLPGISKLNNYAFDGNKIRAWRAYNIGGGKLVKHVAVSTLPELDPIHTQFTHGQSHETLALPTGITPWIRLTPDQIPDTQRATQVTDSTRRWAASFMPDELDSDQDEETTDCARTASVTQRQECADDDPRSLEGPNRQRLFPCDVDGCVKVFQRYHNWWKHVSVGRHTKRVERQLLRDFSIDTYIRQTELNPLFLKAPIVSAALQSQRTEESSSDSAHPLSKGWALKERKEVNHFTEDQKAFLVGKFDEGIVSSKKYDPREISKLMRKDSRFPDKTHWLTAAQIQSFWSRLAQNREKTQATTQNVDDDTDFNHDDQIGDDHVANQIFEDHIDEVIESVRAKIFDNTMTGENFESHIDAVIEAVRKKVCEGNAQSEACE